MMKRSAKLGIMLGILAVLIVGAVIQGVFFPAEKDVGLSEDGASTVMYAANDVAAENVTAISYEKNDIMLSFKKNEEAWMLDEEKAPNIDTDLVSAMVTAISTPAGSNKMENVPSKNLENYGLASPALSVTVHEGAKVRTYLFGNYNKTAKEYYFCDKAIPDTVFTVPSSCFEAFSYTLEDLIVHEKLPEIAADSITSVSLESTEGKTTISAIKTPTDENEEGYEFSAVIEKNGAEEEYSYAELHRMAEAIAEWNIDEFVTLNADDSSEYGFDSPSYLTVNYTERKEIEAEGTSGGYIDTDKSFTLVIGKADENGKYFVKTNEDSRLIYKISTNIFSEIFG